MNRRPRPPFPWRDYLRFFPFPLVGGVLIGLVLSGFQMRPRMMMHSSFIAVSCFSCAFLLAWILEPWLSEKGWVRALVYFAGSQIGWPLGVVLGLPIFWGAPIGMFTLSRNGWIAVIGTGAFGALAGAAMYTFDLLKERLARSIEQLKEREWTEKELTLAREFQARMMPSPEIAGDGYHITARNLAARYVAGDFYDVFRFADGSVGVAVADVAGKGLAASLIMASVKSVLPLLDRAGGVAGMMKALNTKLVSELSRREFVAMALARYEPTTGRIEIANAGLPDPYLLRGGRAEPILVPGLRMPLGIRRDAVYETSVVDLSRGDSVLFLSDGTPEALADGEPLGYERLQRLIASSSGVDDLLARVAEIAVADDDQTMLMLTRQD